MRNNHFTNKINGARMVATLFGALAGIGGLVHGIGEALQGNVAPGSIVFDSWAWGPIATNMSGEPAMSILPNLLLTGVLAVVFSLAVLIWSLFFINRNHGGRILILLSLGMLLFGGGFGPPLIGLLAGWAGTMIDSPLTGWRGRLSPSKRLFAAHLWPWFFGLAAISATFLVIGSLILVFLFGVNNADLFLNIFYLTALSLLCTVLLTPFYDGQAQDRQVMA